MTKILITGIGHAHPVNEIPNKIIDQLDIGSSNDWVRERTGIEKRHSVMTAEQIRDLRFGKVTWQQLRKEGAYATIADMSVKPWEMAKERSGFEGSPDTVICGTSVPDHDIPANASGIAKRLELSSTCFDVNSACSSFVTNLMVAKGLLVSGAANTVGIFNVERYTTRLNYEDRNSCILFGDGAAATIIEKGENLSGLEVLDVIVESDPSGADFVKIEVDETFVQDGKKVQKFAITKTCQVTKKILEKNQLTVDNIGYFIGHQANLRMLETAVRRLEIDPSKHLYNIKEYGNQGGAGAPCVLSQHWDQIEVGAYVIVAVVGSGLTWGAALLRKV